MKCLLRGNCSSCDVQRDYWYDRHEPSSPIVQVVDTRFHGYGHLGHTKQYLPTSRGFDEYYGVPYSVDMHPLPLLHNMQVLEREANLDMLTQQYTKRAVEFIDDSKDEPFFLYMAHSYPHLPQHASAGFRGKSNFGIYGDAVQEIDWSVGEVLDALKRKGIERNTLVFFTSGSWPAVSRERRQLAWEKRLNI